MPEFRQHLTMEQMRSHLEKVTYRPGWRFVVMEDEFEGPHLVINAVVPNSYHPEQSVTLNILTPIPPLWSYADMDHWLVWRLIRIESHECREWYKVDGFPPFDPHRARPDVGKDSDPGNFYKDGRL